MIQKNQEPMKIKTIITEFIASGLLSSAGHFPTLSAAIFSARLKQTRRQLRKAEIKNVFKFTAINGRQGCGLEFENKTCRSPENTIFMQLVMFGVRTHLLKRLRLGRPQQTAECEHVNVSEKNTAQILNNAQTNSG